MSIGKIHSYPTITSNIKSETSAINNDHKKPYNGQTYCQTVTFGSNNDKTSICKLDKIPLKTNLGLIYVKNHRKSIKFQKAIDEIRKLKSKNEKRKIKDITNILLEYMGYPKNSVNIEITQDQDDDGFDVYYESVRHRLGVSNLDTNNEEDDNIMLASHIFHELTHMDNAAKIVKRYGYMNLLAIEAQRVKENFPDMSDSEIKGEFLLGLISMPEGKSLEDIAKYAKAGDTDFLEKLIQTTYGNKITDDTLLNRASFDYKYYNSVDEITAYYNQNQLLKAAGKAIHPAFIDKALAEEANKIVTDVLCTNWDIKSMPDFIIKAIEEHLNEKFKTWHTKISKLYKVADKGNQEARKLYKQLLKYVKPKMPNTNGYDEFLFYSAIKRNNPELILELESKIDTFI